MPMGPVLMEFQAGGAERARSRRWGTPAGRRLDGPRRLYNRAQDLPGPDVLENRGRAINNCINKYTGKNIFPETIVSVAVGSYIVPTL